VEAVHVLFRPDGREDGVGIDLPRQGELDEDSVDRSISVQPADEVEQLLLGGGVRQPVEEGREPRLQAPLFLLPDIDLGSGVRADEHRDEAGDHIVLGLEFVYFLLEFFPDMLGDNRAVDEFCCHSI
jgi:hypothetical protein